MAQPIHNEQQKQHAQREQHLTLRRMGSFQRLSPQMILILLLLLSACGGAQDDPNAVVEPTATPQPPVLTLIFPADEAGETDTAAIAGEIRRRSGLTVDVRLVETSAALDAACTPSEEGIPAAVWLEGIPYAAAVARACGLPVMQVGRVPVDADLSESDATEEPDGEATEEASVEIIATESTDITATDEPSRQIPANVFTGLPGVIVVNSDESAAELSAITEGTFCRPSVSDLYGWLLPMLMFQAEGVDLNASGITIVDLDAPDTETVIEAVASGECALAGLPENAVAELPENVAILRTSPAVPFSVLMMPTEIDASTRDAVIDALLAMADDSETSGLLSPSLQQAVLVEASEADFVEFNTFIASTGLNLAGFDQ